MDNNSKKPDKPDLAENADKTENLNNCPATSNPKSDNIVKKYKDIFGDGFVNVDALIADESDSANINTINEVVDYIKSEGEKLIVESLNRVKATKPEYDILAKSYLESVSHADLINTIALMLTFFFTFSITLKVEQISLIYPVLGCVLSFVVLIIFVLFSSKHKLKLIKEKIKYLTYLEKQLESAIEDKNEEDKNEENSNAETNYEASDK